MDLGAWTWGHHVTVDLGTWTQGHHRDLRDTEMSHQREPVSLKSMGTITARSPWTWAPEGHGDISHHHHGPGHLRATETLATRSLGTWGRQLPRHQLHHVVPKV